MPAWRRAPGRTARRTASGWCASTTSAPAAARPSDKVGAAPRRAGRAGAGSEERQERCLQSKSISLLKRNQNPVKTSHGVPTSSVSTRHAHRRSPCPLACSLDLFGDAWTLLVVRDLLFGPRRFKELAASSERIPTNLLIDRLARLVRHDLVWSSGTPEGGCKRPCLPTHAQGPLAARDRLGDARLGPSTGSQARRIGSMPALKFFPVDRFRAARTPSGTSARVPRPWPSSPLVPFRRAWWAGSCAWRPAHRPARNTSSCPAGTHRQSNRTVPANLLTNACGALAGMLIVSPARATNFSPRKANSISPSRRMNASSKVMPVRGRAAAGWNHHVDQAITPVGFLAGNQDRVRYLP